MPITNDNPFDNLYFDLIANIIHRGVRKEDRTGTGTMSVFGHQMRFDLTRGFPLITVKKTLWKPIVHELLWFLKGDTNVRYLKENGVNIWDSWVKEETAERRDLTVEEIRKKLEKDFKTAVEVSAVNEAVEIDPETKYLTCEDGEGTVTTYITVRMPDEWFENHGEGFHDVELDMYRQAHRDVFGKEPVALVAGELGPVYGAQWRSWPDVGVVENDSVDGLVAKGYEDLGPIDSDIDGKGYCHHSIVRRTIDQIANVVEMLKNNPDSRRLIVSAWNPALVDEMALPPCHALFQFYTAPLSFEERKEIAASRGLEFDLDGETLVVESDISEMMDQVDIPKHRLSCQLYQRSADVFLGVPFNIASYSLLTLMIAQVVNMVPGDFVWTGGDCHIYSNHMSAVHETLGQSHYYEPPTVRINPKVKDIFSFTYEDFELVGYESNKFIGAPVAV